MQNRQNGTAHPAVLCANILVLIAAGALPLYMPNGYVGLVGGKFRLLLTLVLLAAAALPLCLLAGRVRGVPLPARPPRAEWLWPVGLCAAYTVAWLFAQNRHIAFWGLTGRKNGLALLLACAALYLIAARFAAPGLPYFFELTLTGAGCAATIISWMNYWMLDPLDAYYTFLPENGELFLGPVGNINFYGALLCLCIPVAVSRLMQAGSPRRCAVWAVCSLLLCSGLLIAGSDAAWIGAACSVLALCCCRGCTARELARVAALAAGLALCGLAAGLAGRWLPARAALRTVSALLGDWRAALPLAAVFAAAAFALRRGPVRGSARAVRLAVCLLLLAVAAAFAAVNLLGFDAGPAAGLLRFDERWGSNRGYVWQRLWVVYTEDTSLLQKLFGLGGDAADARLNPDYTYTAYMILLNGEPFDSAHNEYLQHLLCGGAVGLACWLGFVASHLRRGFAKNPALAAALTGYAVQAFFSISMPGVLPLVYLAAAMIDLPASGRRGIPAASLLGAGLLAVPAALTAGLLTV